MSYPLVNIVNSTSLDVKGEVDYMSNFCSDDSFTISPNASWTAESRGVCLVTKVSATVQTPSGKVDAIPYTSSGTSYSMFVIIQTGPLNFEVTRRVEAMGDRTPTDYVEPTKEQK